MKEVSSKRVKTDEDHLRMSDIEWKAGLYVADGQIVIPGDVMEAAFVAAARSIKKGKAAQAGVFCEGYFPLAYDGPENLDELSKLDQFKLKTTVRVQQAKVVRTRPLFENWSLDVALNVNMEIFNEAEITRILEHCGQNTGLCDWRPKYGRFKVEKLG